MRRLPIRVRLTAFFAVGTAILLAVLAGLIYVHTGAALLDAVDTGLRARSEVLTASVHEHGLGLVDLAPTLIESDEAFAQVSDGSGRVLASSSIVAGAVLLPPSMATSISQPRFFDRYLSAKGVDNVTRVLAVPVNAPSGRYIVAVATSLQDRKDALVRFATILEIWGPIALTALSLGGWFVIGAALRPVERMQRKAAAVSVSDAGTRLPVPPGGDQLTRLGETLNEMLGRLQDSYEEIEELNEGLEEKVHERTQQVEDARNRIVQSLSLAAEYRDDQTGKHTQRVGEMSRLISQRLGLSPERVELIGRTAPLHDVGKIAIPDRVLLKPGKLSAEEWEEMKQHPLIGATLLGEEAYPLIATARLIAITHHERFDGTGYPHGLKGESIPIEGRIVSVADVFDALTHERPYKEAWPVDRALEEIESGRGTQFDPDVVAAFRAVQDKCLRSGLPHSADLRVPRA